MQVEEVGAFLRALGLADGEDAAQGEDVPFITIRSGPAPTPAQSLQPFPRACWRLLLCLSLPGQIRPPEYPRRGQLGPESVPLPSDDLRVF